MGRVLHGLGLGLCIILLVGATLFFGRDLLRGLSIDVLQSMIFVKHDLMGPESNLGSNEPAGSSDVSLIMLDEASYRSAALAKTPRVLWTPEFATVISAVMEADSKILGLDIILPTTAANWTGDRSHDRTFMQALAKYGRREGRLLMGEVYLETSSLSPFKGFAYAIGGAKNIYPLNVIPDSDNVIRKIPNAISVLTTTGENLKIPSFAAEIIRRALSRENPEDSNKARDKNKDRDKGEGFFVNYDPNRSLEVHSFSQVLKCAQAGSDDYFRKAFAGKVVLLGLDLAVEDRFQSSNRFSAQDNTRAVADCNGDVQARAKGQFGTAGVTILGNGISNKLAGTTLRISDRYSDFAIVFLVGLLAMMIAVRLQSWQSFCGIVLVFLILFLVAFAVDPHHRFEYRIQGFADGGVFNALPVPTSPREPVTAPTPEQGNPVDGP